MAERVGVSRRIVTAAALSTALMLPLAAAASADPYPPVPSPVSLAPIPPPIPGIPDRLGPGDYPVQSATGSGAPASEDPSSGFSTVPITIAGLMAALTAAAGLLVARRRV